MHLKCNLLVGLVLVAATTKATLAEVPLPCREAGYNLETFESDFSRSDEAFDESDSYQPGYKWYRWNWFNVKPNRGLARLRPDGSISAQGGFDGHLVSAARSPRLPGFVGTAFGGGACVQATLKFDPVRSTAGVGHPSFWAMSKEHLDQSGDDRWPGKSADFTHFAEWDILEYYKVPPPGFLSSWIDWFGPYIEKGELVLGGRTCHRPFCKRAGSFGLRAGAFPPQTDWNEWQTVIGLWVPATADRPGCIQTFLNDAPIAPPHCWRNLQTTREREEDFLDFSVIDRHRMVLVISSGDTPILVRSVRVFQQSARENLTNDSVR